MRDDTLVDGARIMSVRVTDIDMPFGSMVAFMLKWAIATIPAALVLALVGFVLFVGFGTLATLTR